MKKSALIYIILASALWGTSGIFVKYLSPYGVTSLQMTFIRGLVAVACMGIFVLMTDMRTINTNLKELILFAGSGFSFFMPASCYYQSMRLTSVSTAVVLMYTAPIFVMIYSVAFLNEKLSNYSGDNLDPVMSLRNSIEIQPNSSEVVYLIVGFGRSKEQIQDIIKSYSNEYSIEAFLLGRWEDGAYYDPYYFELEESDNDGLTAQYNLPNNDVDGYFYLKDGFYALGKTENSAKRIFVEMLVLLVIGASAFDAKFSEVRVTASAVPSLIEPPT